MALFAATKPDHPMADPKQARELIAELPSGDSAKTLDEVTFWLDSVGRTDGFKLDYRFQLYDALDQAAKSHQRKLSQDYLATSRQEKFREAKLWNALFEFWKTLGLCYMQCIEQFQAGAPGAGALRGDLPVLIGRALRTLTLQLKWSALRYGPVDDRIWGDLGRIYLFAESKGFATTPIAIYPGSHGQGTVEREFLKALMLGVSSTDGLTPLKQEIAERTVAHFGGLYEMRRQPGPGCGYFFDLSMREAPARVQKSHKPNPMIRYLGAAKALPALRELMENIKTRHGIPSDVNLGGSYDLDLVSSVLSHLAMYWSDKPPARNHERRKIATRLTVVNGLDQILRSVRPLDEGLSLDFQAKDFGESWIVENISDGGYGAIVPQVKGDWLKVGALIGLQAETAKYWGAGVIRRLTRDEFQQRCVGIQLISKGIIPVKLSAAGGVSSLNPLREGEPGILLSTGPDKHGEITLLMRVGTYSQTQPLEMAVHGKRYFLMPRRLVEGGEDFDWGRFKVLKNE